MDGGSTLATWAQVYTIRTATTPSTGPAITVSPMRATLTDSRPSCRDAILAAIDRLERRTGISKVNRRDIVVEVQSAGASFERQTIYRCIRCMTGHEPGSAHHDLEDIGDGQLQIRT